MKVLLKFLIPYLLVSLVPADEPSDPITWTQILGSTNVCQKVWNISDVSVTIFSSSSTPTDPNFSCFINCVLEGLKVIWNERLNTAKALQFVGLLHGGDPEINEDVIINCHEEYKKSSVSANCDRAYNVTKCILAKFHA